MAWGKATFSSMLEAPPPLDRRQALAGVPSFTKDARAKENASGNITVFVTVRRRPGFLGKFQPPQWERTIELDELGSFVASQIDGKRTALEIVDVFVERFKINRREAELSTMAFLKSLVERNIILIAVPLPEEEKGAQNT
ncbi:MAG TPA: PqqD family protein [Planctomycetota bacterium]|nr:PqqD family protein [Planctomycetota bacterium]